MSGRGHAATRPDPGGFRCLVCREYVIGTEAGHCPRCGFVPPAAPPVVEPNLEFPWAIAALIAFAVIAVIAISLL